jgi:hypothetical protein
LNPLMLSNFVLSGNRCVTEKLLMTDLVTLEINAIQKEEDYYGHQRISINETPYLGRLKFSFTLPFRMS